jgi:hypothetical protein
MERIRSPKRRFELELQGTKSQDVSIIGTAVRAFQKTVFFDNDFYPSMEGTLKMDTIPSPKRRFQLELHSTKFKEASIQVYFYSRRQKYVARNNSVYKCRHRNYRKNNYQFYEQMFDKMNIIFRQKKSSGQNLIWRMWVKSYVGWHRGLILKKWRWSKS